MLNEKGQVIPGGPHCAPDSENGKVPNPIYHHYRRVLKSLYAIQFKIDSTDITTVLRDVLGLVEVAEYLGSVHKISQTIDLALVTQGATLFRSVAGNPLAWIQLAVRVQSQVVFKEAVIHMVGKWNMMSDGEKATLDPAVKEVCKRKHEELDNVKMGIEHNIMKHYPPELQRTADDGSNAYNRQNYGNDILAWIATTLYKHWFASAVTQDRHRHAKDGGYWLYNLIAEGGNAYLTAADQGAFHRRFPMSVKGGQVFSNHLMNIKEQVKHLVTPLLVNKSLLDTKEHNCKYLTCVDVGEDDMPWRIDREGEFGADHPNGDEYDDGLLHGAEDYQHEDYDDEMEPLPKRMRRA